MPDLEQELKNAYSVSREFTRYGEVVIAHHDTVIEPDDHVIIFCTRKKLVKKVEKLFQVGFHFL